MTFHPNSNLQEVVNQGPPRTTLTEWFKLNLTDPFARSLLYRDIPKFYTWKRDKSWQRRVQLSFFGTLGRLYTAHPREGERFYLRILLGHVRGATSFDDLKKVDEQVCGTFQEACLRLGLLETDTEWDAAMEEAVSFMPSPHRIRQLFAVILTHCHPSDARALWEKYKNSMTDLGPQRHVPPLTTSQLEDLALIDLNNLLAGNGSSLAAFDDLPPLPQNPLDNRVENVSTLMAQELNYDTEALEAEVADCLSQLKEGQRAAYDAVMGAVFGQETEGWEGGAFFLAAAGGCGKTYLLNTLLKGVRAQGKIALSVATSGLAAILLEGGTTAHSRFKLPLDVNEGSFCNISPAGSLGDLLQATRLIVWDEAPMSHRHNFECLDRTLRDVMGRDILFGGIPVLLSGDFRQIPPVVPRASPSGIVNASIIKSPLWERFTVLTLDVNLRAMMLEGEEREEQEAWANFLLGVGEGVGGSEFPIPEDLHFHGETKEEFVEEVFGDLSLDQNRSADALQSKAILCPTNKSVREFNLSALKAFGGEGETEYVYFSVDKVESEDDMTAHYPQEVLNSLEFGGLPSHELRLKVGVPVMLLRNLCPARGLANGTRLIITHLTPHGRVLQARICSGPFANQEVLIPRIICSGRDQHRFPLELQRRQFPVRLAFAMSISKSQGQTLSKVGVALTTPCFSHGQLYVALSRVGRRSAVKIMNHPPDQGWAMNVVYPELIEAAGASYVPPPPPPPPPDPPNPPPPPSDPPPAPVSLPVPLPLPNNPPSLSPIRRGRGRPRVQARGSGTGRARGRGGNPPPLSLSLSPSSPLSSPLSFSSSSYSTPFSAASPQPFSPSSPQPSPPLPSSQTLPPHMMVFMCCLNNARFDHSHCGRAVGMCPNCHRPLCQAHLGGLCRDHDPAAADRLWYGDR